MEQTGWLWTQCRANLGSGPKFLLTGKNTGKNGKINPLGPPAHGIAQYLWAFLRFLMLSALSNNREYYLQ
jgi:hypothetical protein